VALRQFPRPAGIPSLAQPDAVAAMIASAARIPETHLISSDNGATEQMTVATSTWITKKRVGMLLTSGVVMTVVAPDRTACALN
jgi:hypothetical protein